LGSTASGWELFFKKFYKDLLNLSGVTEIIGVRRDSAAGIAGESHCIIFIFANLFCNDIAKLTLQFVIDRIAKTEFVFGFNAAVLTCIGHEHTSCLLQPTSSCVLIKGSDWTAFSFMLTLDRQSYLPVTSLPNEKGEPTRKFKQVFRPCQSGLIAGLPSSRRPFSSNSPAVKMPAAADGKEKFPPRPMLDGNHRHRAGPEITVAESRNEHRLRHIHWPVHSDVSE
jgi:hypothetical protein